MSFVLDAYAPDDSRSGALYRYLRFEGRASLVSPQVARKQFSPTVTTKSFVNDFRLPLDPETPYIHYVISNAWLTSTNAPLFGSAVLQNRAEKAKLGPR